MKNCAGRCFCAQPFILKSVAVFHPDGQQRIPAVARIRQGVFKLIAHHGGDGFCQICADAASGAQNLRFIAEFIAEILIKPNGVIELVLIIQPQCANQFMRITVWKVTRFAVAVSCAQFSGQALLLGFNRSEEHT